MNQKPVDDKELGKLLKHILVDRFSRYDTAEVLIKEMIPALNAHYQKKYLGLLEKLREEYNVVFIADGKGGYQREEVILLDIFDEAIANIGGMR